MQLQSITRICRRLQTVATALNRLMERDNQANTEQVHLVSQQVP